MNQESSTLIVKEEPEKKRIALVIQYLGTNYHGWQRQPSHHSVQAEIENTLATVLNHPVTLHGAGRTDSGVHAAAQVAHFEQINCPIPAYSWAAILNSRLPKDILILASAEVPQTWHARFSAIWRRYRYTIYTEKQPNLFVKQLAWHYYNRELDESLIQSALKPLKGTHDLSAFRRAGAKRPHSLVEVQEVEGYRIGPFFYLEIQANGFLYGMVRLLVGMLIEVGIGKITPASLTDIWLNQRRAEVKYSAPAQGLCLLRVGYRDFPLPQEIWFDTQPLFIFGNPAPTFI